MSYEAITFEVSAGVAEITLNDPVALNALSSRMLAELRLAFDEVRANDEIRAVLLTGAGRAFSSGANLAEDGGDPNDLDLKAILQERYNPLVRDMRDLEKPIVGAVPGIAAGAGMGVALSCDILLAAESAQFIQLFTRIGVMPDAGCTWLLPQRVGLARAKAMALLTDPVDGKTAEAWGMIWKCLPDAELMDEARKMAKQLASRATMALGKTKRAIDAAATNSLDVQLDLEAEWQGELGDSYDFKEGVMAFLEKRPAEFKGK